MAGSRSWDDIGYREAIENCRTWNAQMGHGRRERLPFFDDHTQVHQVSFKGRTLTSKIHETINCLGNVQNLCVRV